MENGFFIELHLKESKFFVDHCQVKFTLRIFMFSGMYVLKNHIQNGKNDFDSEEIKKCIHKFV